MQVSQKKPDTGEKPDIIKDELLKAHYEEVVDSYVQHGDLMYVSGSWWPIPLSNLHSPQTIMRIKYPIVYADTNYLLRLIPWSVLKGSTTDLSSFDLKQVVKIVKEDKPPIYGYLQGKWFRVTSEYMFVKAYNELNIKEIPCRVLYQ